LLWLCHDTSYAACVITQVFLYQQPINFRKAHLGLCGIIECELGHDPFAGHLYVFTNKRRNKIKYLFWEDNGFVLYYKSLSEEKFKWPKPQDKLITLTGQPINWLLDGYDISAMKGHEKLHDEAVF
jgi:transposase